MKQFAGFVLISIGGAFLGQTGLDPLDFQWWAIVLPLVVGMTLI